MRQGHINIGQEYASVAPVEIKPKLLSATNFVACEKHHCMRAVVDMSDNNKQKSTIYNNHKQYPTNHDN